MNSRQVTAAVAALMMATSVVAETLVTETDLVSFLDPAMDTYAAGFSSSQRGHMVVSDGQAHLTATYDANHMDRLQYRRYDPGAGFTGNWAGSVVTLGTSTNPLDEGFSDPFVAVDGDDRVSIVYKHKTGGVYTWYQRWCDNASGADPLNSANWSAPVALGVPTGGAGDMIAIGANTLLLAQYRDGTATPDGDTDITIEKGVWNGSGYTWSSLGTVLEATQQGYGGLRAPNLTYDGTGLHMSLYSAEVNGSRGIQYSYSGDALNPTAGTWTAREDLKNIDATYRETNGGAGVMEDGTVMGLIWATNNRDGLAVEANFTRTRAGGTWGAWEQTFVGDTRRMPTSYGSGSNHVATAFAPDGMGGLFAVYDLDYVSHYDPVTETWADAFTNIPVSGAPSGNIEVVFGGRDAWSRVYHFSRGNNTLYVGHYYAVPEPATLTVLGLAVVGCCRRRRANRTVSA